MTAVSRFYNPTVPAHVPPELVHDFDIFDPGRGVMDHFAGFRYLHEIGVPDIFWSRDNGGHWVIARGEYIPEAAADPSTFSSTRMMVPDHMNLDTLVLRPIAVDPPIHTTYRALIQPLFMPRTIAGMHDDIRNLAVSLTEGVKAKGRCDFVADFALHMPIGIFMNLVDLPESHRLELLELVNRMLRPSDERKDDVIAIILDYLRPIIAERRANPGTDIYSRLAASKVDGRPLKDDELEGICALLLVGGLDSVANTMALVAHFLADNPDHRHDLIEHPEILPNAVEELLRRFPTVTGPNRYLIKDTVFHDVAMKKGDHIILPRAMYNFDHRLFEDPMTVDFRRPRPIHASFGTAGGPHRCPGSFLARTEITIFLEEWLKRIPDFSVELGAEVKYEGGSNVSIHSLPLIWDTAR